MTKEILSKTIEIKKKIRELRSRKVEIKKVQAWCKIDEMRAREAEIKRGRTGCRQDKVIFRIQTQEGDCNRDSTTISGSAAKMLLDKELKDIKIELETLQNELSDLH